MKCKKILKPVTLCIRLQLSIWFMSHQKFKTHYDIDSLKKLYTFLIESLEWARLSTTRTYHIPLDMLGKQYNLHYDRRKEEISPSNTVTWDK